MFDISIKSCIKKTCAIVQQILYIRSPRLYRISYALYKRVTDKGERLLCKSIIKPGMVVVDIGANIGSYTSFFQTLVGRTGSVHAFEPAPQNYSFLKRALSPHENVFLNQAAVSDRTGEILLHISPALNVDHRTYDSGDNRKKITVPTVSLDDYFVDGMRVDFIKMDIQGYEYQALLGMRQVLEKFHDVVVMMEYEPEALNMAGTSGDKLLSFLHDKGFSIYEISRCGNLIPLDEVDPKLSSLGYINVVAMRKDMRAFKPVG